jgi:antitoxin component YwqK of YwqJK toxin-antitoxin module
MNSSAVEDRQILNTYIRLRKKKIDFLKKMISYGSFIFLDSTSLIHSQIEQLPKLKYPLDFYASIPDKDTLESKEIMFDNNWNITKEVADKVYTRKFKSDKIGRTQGWTYDYYSNGNIQMKGYYQNNILNGITFYYYPNGACHSVGCMIEGEKIGKWQYFYKSRTLQSEIQYDPGHRSKMLAFFDSTGTQLVFNGNGMIREYDETENLINEGSYKNYFKDDIWTGYYPNGSPFYKEVYKDGDFVKGESFSSDRTRRKYERPIEYPEPINGWEKYKHYIDSAVAACPKSPSSGVVSIQLFIDSTGYIKSMKPIMMIGSHCEDTLMKIIKKGPLFNPGKIRGQIKAMRIYVFGAF